MLKKLYFFITCLSLIGLAICSIIRINYYSFNSNNVKENIEYLSSDKFEGRIAGSDSNEEVAREIKSLFKQYGLLPLSKDYLQPFSVKAPVYNSTEATIKILNGTTVVDELKLGKDFKEDMINFKSSSVKITKADNVQIFPKAILVKKGNLNYLFYITYDENYSFRSSFKFDSNYEFAIQINTDSFKKILDSIRDGYTISVNLPYTVQHKTVYNVAGKIKGSDSSLAPLIITAHFDHLGSDSMGNVYSGALDNASGTAFLLELARTFSSLVHPKRDIIFVALNAEEFGLLGSKDFAEKYSKNLKGADVINFDMVGASGFPITFMNGKDTIETEPVMLKNLEAICIDKRLEFLCSYENSSDHASFIKNGFNAVTITHSNISVIHTPADTADKISENAIDDVYTLVKPYIVDESYSNFTMMFYKNYMLIFFTVTSAGLVLIYYLRNKSIVISDKLKVKN